MTEIIKCDLNIMSMKGRDILDKFAKRQQKKLKVCPNYISGNFIILIHWVIDYKEFNRNPKNLRTQFWEDLRKTCKRSGWHIDYSEEDLK